MSFTNAGVWLLGVCALPVAAMAQGSAGASAPAAEVGIHYAYNSVAASNESGASAYGEYFLKKLRLGLIADFSGSGSASGSLYTYLFGWRFNTEWRKSHLVAHAEYKFGGAHVRVNGVNSTGSSASFARNSLASDLGVGLDLRVGRHYVVTLLQADLPEMEVPDAASGVSHWHNDLRISGGIGFRFGGMR